MYIPVKPVNEREDCSCCCCCCCCVEDGDSGGGSDVGKEKTDVCKEVG
jgi:hypothetical protein